MTRYFTVAFIGKNVNTGLLLDMLENRPVVIIFIYLVLYSFVKSMDGYTRIYWKVITKEITLLDFLLLTELSKKKIVS